MEGTAQRVVYSVHRRRLRAEVWVNIGYRLSAFGFLASDEPKIDGNFGFKDQWLALLWVRANIKAFGGTHVVVTRPTEEDGRRC